jgi:hypothetical protein
MSRRVVLQKANGHLRLVAFDQLTEGDHFLFDMLPEFATHEWKDKFA